jgi:adenine nucleotide transporter 17
MTARKQETVEKVLPGAQPAKAPSSFGTLMALLRNEGPAALFAGVLPALVLVINPILQYTIFEQLKNALEKRRKATATDVFFLGAIGKLLATGITYPYITVKSRAHVAGKESAKENMLESFGRIRREEGWAGLYKGNCNLSIKLICRGSERLTILLATGIGPKVTQSVITAALLFTLKDALYDLTIKARRRMTAKNLTK